MDVLQLNTYHVDVMTAQKERLVTLMLFAGDASFNSMNEPAGSLLPYHSSPHLCLKWPNNQTEGPGILFSADNSQT